MYVVVCVLLSSAVVAQGEPPGVKNGIEIPLSQLASRPTAHLGQRISVDAVVRRVLGPRLFTLIGPDRVGGDHEMLVFVPPPGLALVRAGTAATIIGTVRRPTTAELVHEWGWIRNGSSNGNTVDDRVMIVTDATVSSSSTRGVESDAELTNVSELAESADEGLVGRAVNLRNTRITAVVARGGFWIASSGEQLFVLPGDAALLRQGQRVNIRGVVLELPHGMRGRLDDDIAARNEAIYVYANQIRTL